MLEGTLLYNGVNMYQLAYLRIEKYNNLMPPLRPRKVEIPGRSGAVDYGAEYHGERSIRAECVIERDITNEQFDSLKYELSKKGHRIIFWNERDRFYTGRVYESAEVLEYHRTTRKTFPLVFICEPYATAIDPLVLHTKELVLPIHYAGTRKSPTRITIRNTGNTPLSGITLTARSKV